MNCWIFLKKIDNRKEKGQLSQLAGQADPLLGSAFFMKGSKNQDLSVSSPRQSAFLQEKTSTLYIIKFRLFKINKVVLMNQYFNSIIFEDCIA